MAEKVFWIEPTGEQALYLRRYSRSGTGSDCASGYHTMMVPIGSAPESRDDKGYVISIDPALYAKDQRWPLHCKCGYEFTADDERQVFTDSIYVRPDTGERFPLREAPVCSMYDAWWYGYGANWRGSDGICLVIKLPNGFDWVVDGACNNCEWPTPDDGQREHHCWIRHGDPKTGLVTVDKKGVTCTAGGGSIQSGDFHKRLVNGEFI